MDHSRNRPREWGDVSDEKYNSGQIDAILTSIGVEVRGETYHEYTAYCPFHANRDTPSFSISKTSGVYLCFNGACGETGPLSNLVRHMTGKNDFQVLRLINQSGLSSSSSFIQEFKKSLEPATLAPEFSQTLLDRMYEDFWKEENSSGRDYMHGRNFNDETLHEFKVGYSQKQNMVSTPMHDADGRPVGLIGRSASRDQKTFKNSTGLPTSKTLWNVHRAKRHGDTAIVVEANFDGMRVAQAGYPNVVACLGGNFSPYHAEQLGKYFNRIVIMTDFDLSSSHTYTGCRKCARLGFNSCKGHNPGRALGETIAHTMKNKQIQWASYDTGIVYPPGVKDAGDMSDDDIRRCIKNSASNFIYHTWSIPS